METVYQGCVLDQNVLVLNKHYTALRITSVKRALSLLYRQHAEVINCEQGTFGSYDFHSWTEISQLKRNFEPHTHDWIKTVDCHLAVPKIVRLLVYDRLPRRTVKLNRRNIFARDNSRCQYCGKKQPLSELSLDHVLPKSLGGKSTWQNLVCACTKCNSKKGGRTPAQAKMKLITKPIKPNRNPVIHLHLSHAKYQSWKHFLNEAYWSVELK